MQDTLSLLLLFTDGSVGSSRREMEDYSFCSCLIMSIFAQQHTLRSEIFNHGHLMHSFRMYPEAILISGVWGS